MLAHKQHAMHQRFSPALTSKHVCCSVKLGSKMSKALRAFIWRIHPRETRDIRRSEIWKAGPAGRLVESCTSQAHWDNSGKFFVRNVELSLPSFWSADTSPHAAYIFMYKHHSKRVRRGSCYLFYCK